MDSGKKFLMKFLTRGCPLAKVTLIPGSYLFRANFSQIYRRLIGGIKNLLGLNSPATYSSYYVLQKPNRSGSHPVFLGNIWVLP